MGLIFDTLGSAYFINITEEIFLFSTTHVDYFLHFNPPALTGRLPILHILSRPPDECNNLQIPAQSEVYRMLIFLFVC